MGPLPLPMGLSLSLLLPSSCFCPTLAVLMPCSLQTPILHIPSFSPVPTQLLPSFFPALLLVLPTPVWQPSSSSSAPYDFFRHGESRLLWQILLHQVSLRYYSNTMADLYYMHG